MKGNQWEAAELASVWGHNQSRTWTSQPVLIVYHKRSVQYGSYFKETAASDIVSVRGRSEAPEE